MDSTAWRRARELFEQALDQPANARAAFLVRIPDLELRSRVERLLADLEGVASASWLDGGVDQGLVGRAFGCAPGKVPADGQRIGEFVVRGVLGSGGMATVLEAEQEHPQRRVALKIMRCGLMSDVARQRFDFESEILGSLQHPGIAQVYAAGTATDPWTGEDLPYFAMELIDGVPLNEFVATESCDMTTMLRLFVQVCRAVEHGHQRGVVHRDLKPQNILVDRRRQPKVIDFGIARASAAGSPAQPLQTRQGEVLGTLHYMSPEQLDGGHANLDARCDVYALGVILYELIARRRPFDLEGKPITAAAETIRSQAVVRPSNFVLLPVRKDRLVDLDWIVLRAMERDLARRYPSAGDLAAEVERLLAHRPVLARPPSRIYRTRRFVQRHRVAVAAAMMVLASLLAGMTATTLGLMRARSAEADARTSLEVARLESDTRKAVNDFLLQMLAAPSPYADGRQIKVVDLLDRAASSAVRLHEDQPPLATALLTTLGLCYLQLGETASARIHLERAVKIGREGLGSEHRLTLSAIHTLASCLEDSGDLELAEALAREAMAGRDALFGSAAAETARSLVLLAVIAYHQEKLELAATTYRQAQEVILAAEGPDSREAIQISSGLGVVFERLGRRDEAERAFRNAIERGKRRFGDEDPSVLTASNGLATLLLNRDQLGAAAELFGEVLATQERVIGAGHPQTLATLNNLASAMQRLERPVAAERRYRELIERRKAAGRYGEVLTAVALANLGVCLEGQDRLAAAERSFDEALAVAASCGVPNRHWLSAAFRKGLAVVRAKQGRYAEAEATLLDSLAIFEAASGDQTRRIDRTLEALATLYTDWGKPARAREIDARRSLR